MRDSLPKLCLSLIGLLLLGYLLGDKGFAHLGIGPVYIGEVVLALCLGLFVAAPDFGTFNPSPLIWLIVCLDGWCFFRTFPYFDEYGADTLRDAVIYGYSIFAFLIAAYMARQDFIEKFCLIYDKVITASIIVMPLLLLLSPHEVVGPDEVPPIFLKAGDVAVHLAGALAFRLLGLRKVAAPRNPVAGPIIDGLFWISWFISMLWAASASRGGMLAVGLSVLVMLLFGFGRRQVMAFLAGTVLILGLLGLFSVRIEQDRREVSVSQLAANVESVLEGDRFADASDLAATARWRLQWWGDIVDYVVFGDYFWRGRGFGINLADADHYQVDADGTLRSPHNAHITILARAGVPGLVLWLAILASFGFALVRRATAMRRLGAANWQKLNLWILAYWVATLVNATFDVYLEGPQGGIWYWSILGFGLAALAAQDRRLVHQNAAIPLARNGAPA